MKRNYLIYAIVIAVAIGMMFRLVSKRNAGLLKRGTKPIQIEEHKRGRSPAKGAQKTEIKKDQKNVRRAAKIIKNEDGMDIVENHLLLTFSADTKLDDVLKLESAYGLKLSSYTQATQTAHFVRSKSAPHGLSEIKAYVKSEPHVVSADYNHIVNLHQAVPSEFRGAPLYAPWHIYNNGARTYMDELGRIIHAQTHVDIANGQFLSQLWNQSPRRPDCRDVIVAVIDTGIDIRHDELQGQLWQNPNEIPNNNRDDDGNGIVDDVHGAGFTSARNGIVRTGSPAPLLDPEFAFDMYAVGGQQKTLIDEMRQYNANIAAGIDVDTNRSDLYDLYATTLHGTNISGVIAALGNNNQGTFGVCQNVKIMAVRAVSVFDQSGGLIVQPSEAALLLAMDYARENGAHIMNASWGFHYLGPAQDCGDGTLVKSTCPFYNTLKAFAQKPNAPGLIVVSAGNDNSDNDQHAEVPASLSTIPHMNMLSVTSIDANGSKSSFSNYGTQTVNIAAPGSSITTITFGEALRNDLQTRGISLQTLLQYLPMQDARIININGTSFSAPIVLAAAAALKQALRDNNLLDQPSDIKNYLLGFALGTAPLSQNFGTNARRVDLHSALNAIYSGNLPPQTNTGTIAITASTTSSDDQNGGPVGGCGFIDTPGGTPSGGTSPGNNWPILLLYAFPLLLLIRRRFQLIR